MKTWLLSDRGLMILVSVLLVLVCATTTLSTYGLIAAGHDRAHIRRLATPTDREVVDRLKRGVRVMSPEDARQIIGTMSRKARAARP